MKINEVLSNVKFRLLAGTILQNISSQMVKITLRYDLHQVLQFCPEISRNKKYVCNPLQSNLLAADVLHISCGPKTIILGISC